MSDELRAACRALADTMCPHRFLRSLLQAHTVFGWELGTFGLPGDPSGFFRMPGYGAFLAERDPAVRAFQESGEGPEGFGDAVAILQPLTADAAEPSPHWSTTFAVADADAAFARAVEFGSQVVVEPFDTPYTRQSMVRDPQGATFTLSEYRPDANR